MGATKKDFNEIRERYVLTVDKEYYQQHYDTFKPPNTEIRTAFVEGEDHDDDPMHKQLFKAYLNAQKALRDYEYEKRHNTQPYEPNQLS